MSRQQRFQKLLKHPHIWCPGDSSGTTRRVIPSGFQSLDRWLGGGWPADGLTEFLYDEEGIGELSLLMPALALLGNAPENMTASPAVSSDNDWIVWIKPPHIPFAPALSQHGIDISRLLIIQATDQNDILWAIEQTLQSSACIAVFAWLDGANNRSMRRLQLAAESGQCWTIIFRPSRFVTQLSAAPVRIVLQHMDEQVELKVIRNRYGATGSILLQR